MVSWVLFHLSGRFRGMAIDEITGSGEDRSIFGVPRHRIGRVVLFFMNRSFWCPQVPVAYGCNSGLFYCIYIWKSCRNLYCYFVLRCNLGKYDVLNHPGAIHQIYNLVRICAVYLLILPLNSQLSG